MPIAALLPAIIAGGSAIGGALISKHGNSNTQTSTSTSSATYTPEQQAMMQRIQAILMHRLNKGAQVKQGDRDAGRTAINTNYNAIMPNVESNLTARGFGESGKLGSAILGLNVGRANQFQTLESQLQDDAQARYDNTLAQAVNFSRPTGSTTNSTTTLPSQSGLGSAIGGAGTDIATLLYLSKLLKPGSGGVPNTEIGD